jgi:hypothetical protein
MQEMCGFEIMVRGMSKWCDVFTQAEWLGFEYARDVLHYYRAGSVSPQSYMSTRRLISLDRATNLERRLVGFG